MTSAGAATPWSSSDGIISVFRSTTQPSAAAQNPAWACGSAQSTVTWMLTTWFMAAIVPSRAAGALWWRVR